MAIKLNTAYSKKLGLPGYSSHAFSASVEVELADINQVGTECARLYGLLQASVDGEIRNTGYVPDEAYGSRDGSPRRGRGEGRGRAPRGRDAAPYPCSQRQRDLILKVARENGMAPEVLEAFANEHGGAGLDALEKDAASRVIDALFERFGSQRQPHAPAA